MTSYNLELFVIQVFDPKILQKIEPVMACSGQSSLCSITRFLTAAISLAGSGIISGTLRSSAGFLTNKQVIDYSCNQQLK